MRNRADVCHLRRGAEFALLCCLLISLSAAGQPPPASPAAGASKPAVSKAPTPGFVQGKRVSARRSRGTARSSQKQEDWRAAWRRHWVAEHATTAAAIKHVAPSHPKPPRSVPAAAGKPASTPVTAPAKPVTAVPLKPATPALPAAAKSAAPPTAAVTPPKPLPVVPNPAPDSKATDKPPVTPAPAAPAAPVNPLSDTRPDVAAPAPNSKAADKPLDSPMSAVGDGGKMLLYLAPTVLLILFGLRLLRGFQERNGRLPGVLQAAARAGSAGRNAPRTGLLSGLIGNMNLQRAREHSGSSIRVLESVPLGGAHLHLIEVRGRMLLLGATASGMSMLTEFHAQDSLENNEFRTLLEEAATNLDSLELPEDELSGSLLVGALEEKMRDASSAVVRNARRLRTVQEAESAWMQEQQTVDSGQRAVDSME